MSSPWGESTPRKPKAGAGRIALSKRAKARGGGESRSAAKAARRGLARRGERKPAKRSTRAAAAASRRTANRRKGEGGGAAAAAGAAGEMMLGPFRRGWNVLRHHTADLEQTFLIQKKLRTLGLAVVGGWVAWTFLIGDASVPRWLSVKAENSRLEKEVTELEKARGLLDSDVSALKRGEREVVERIARDEHAMVREGEVLVRFYEEDEAK